MNRLLDIRSYFTGVGFAFRSLSNRNFKLFFVGQLISLHGTWIQNIALGWLVFTLTDSPVWLGVVGFAGQIPALFLTPIAGVLADRLNQRKVLLATQLFPMLLSFILAYLSLTGHVKVWHLLVIASLNGVATAFDTPFRHAFVVEMLGGKELLQNAIALNSTLINSARFIGPMLGGFLIHWVGEGMCFLINGVSFLAIVLALHSMRVTPMNLGRKHGSILMELEQGIRYAFGNTTMRHLLLLVITASFVGLPFQVFLPVFARDILGGGSQTLGLLTGAVGAGALLGAIFLASLKGIKHLPRIILATITTFSIGLMGFSLSPNIYLSISLLFVTGFGMIVLFASTNTFLQTMVNDEVRGRVMSLYGMSFLGFTPLGSLLLGYITSFISVPMTVLTAGALCLAVSVIFFRKIGSIKEINT